MHAVVDEAPESGVVVVTGVDGHGLVEHGREEQVVLGQLRGGKGQKAFAFESRGGVSARNAFPASK